MTDGGEPAASAPARHGDGRVGLLAFLRLVLPNSGLALLVALVVGGVILFLADKPRPIIQYEASTEILSLTVAGDLETVWNLPARIAQVPEIVEDASVPKIEPLGFGALLLPEGTTLTIIRIAGQPLRLRIDDVKRDVPRAISGFHAERLALPKGSLVTVPGTEGEACGHELPPLTLRGVGAVTLGATLAKASADSENELAGLEQAEFLARNAQPLLDGGRVFVRGQPVWRRLGGTYDAHELTLQAGDALRVPPSAADTGAVFMLQVAGCTQLKVHGSVQSDKVEVLRLGSDTSKVRVTFWQAVTRDPVLTLLTSALGLFLATYWSFVNERAEKE